MFSKYKDSIFLGLFRVGKCDRFILGKGRVICACKEWVDTYFTVVIAKGDFAFPVSTGSPGFFFKRERVAVIRVEYAYHHPVCRGSGGVVPLIVPRDGDERAVPCRSQVDR